MSKIHLVLLSGGSGTRLWPLSNDARSKQFLKVMRDSEGNHVSMVQRVFSQIRKVPIDIDITIATCENQKTQILQQVDGDYALVLEPERRDTAPAIFLACSHLAYEQHSDMDDTVIVMPIDTFADQEYYNSIVDLDKSVQSGASRLTLLGVEPTYPSEKYGYIVPSLRDGYVWLVKRFTEKPSEDKAKELLKEGALWNCGVFAFKLGDICEIAKKHYAATSFEDMRSHYSLLPKISFDYEVVEKAESVSVIPYAGAWKDLGTWNTLAEEMCDRASGRCIGAETCQNTHVINELGLPLVCLGIDNAVVVATPDGILVADKTLSSNMKPYVHKIAESRPMYEKRLWGEYRVLDSSEYLDDRKSLTKELIISPNQQLSYQRHKSRSEVWTIVSGEGEVVLDGSVHSIALGSVIHVQPQQLHAVRAISELHIIEVQLGSPLIEDDIERYGYFW